MPAPTLLEDLFIVFALAMFVIGGFALADYIHNGKIS